MISITLSRFVKMKLLTLAVILLCSLSTTQTKAQSFNFVRNTAVFIHAKIQQNNFVEDFRDESSSKKEHGWNTISFTNQDSDFCICVLNNSSDTCIIEFVTILHSNVSNIVTAFTNAFTKVDETHWIDYQNGIKYKLGYTEQGQPIITISEVH